MIVRASVIHPCAHPKCQQPGRREIEVLEHGAWVHHSYACLAHVQWARQLAERGC